MSTLREDDLVQEILAQAQHALAIRAAARQRRHERRWRVALLTLGLLLFAALVLLPGTLADKLTLLVHGVCAQSHQLTIGGTLLPLCIRDTGIYSGFVITCAYLLLRGRLRAGKLPRLPITLALVGFILLLAIDGFNSLLFDLGATTLYPPQNTLRLITGLIMGVALGVLLSFAFSTALLASINHEQRLLGSWAELGTLLGLTAVLFMLISVLRAPWWLASPLAILSVAGLLSVLLLTNVLVLATLAGREKDVTRLWQLAPQWTIGLVLALAELGLLAALRIQLTV